VGNRSVKNSADGYYKPEMGAPAGIWHSEMQPLIRHVAAADVPVLVRGETGVGKEVLARQIHSLSARATKPFLKVNCAALPSELIESELFGYERGAFTGAFKCTAGKFEMADGGTILLDEIGDMDFKLQAKLLQVLQDSEFTRLGSSEARRVDVRVIAATHCDLEQAIAESRFREDLYYRLNVIMFHVPSLRDRTDEIIQLAYHFLRKHALPHTPPVEITPMLCDALLSHDWPGNIRELENVIRRLLVLRRPDYVAQDLRLRARLRKSTSTASGMGGSNDTVARFPSPVRDSTSEQPALHPAPLSLVPAGPAEPRKATLEAPVHNGNGHRMRAAVPETADKSILERVDRARREAETEAILTALNSTLWNRKRAAKLLNIDYKALLYRMKKLDIVERAAHVAM
jgi:transcriptional regulator with PAS, ATPase and Fis domain